MKCDQVSLILRFYDESRLCPPSCNPPPSPKPAKITLPEPGTPLKPCKIRENTWFLRYFRPPEPPWSLLAWPPRKPQDAPGRAQEAPRRAQEAPKRPPEGPKRPPRRHQKAQEAPKRRPEAPRPQAHGTTSLLALGGRRQEGVAPWIRPLSLQAH